MCIKKRKNVSLNAFFSKFPPKGLGILGVLPMTVVARNIGVHFLDENTIANLSRIMFSHRTSPGSNSTQEKPVSPIL